jgi:cell division septum initiation protein DivIVA
MGESVVHRAAKRWAAQIINEWRAGDASRPIVQSRCDVCGSERTFPLPASTVDAVEEHRLPSGRVVDVWAGFAVEVFQTHRVDVEKASDLSIDGIAWIEVHAGPLTEDPPRWVSSRTFSRDSCPSCVQTQFSIARSELRAIVVEVETGKRRIAEAKAAAEKTALDSQSAHANARVEAKVIRDDARASAATILTEAKAAAETIRSGAKALGLADADDIVKNVEADREALARFRAILESDVSRFNARVAELGLLDLETTRDRLQRSIERLRESPVAFCYDGQRVTKNGLFEGSPKTVVWMYPSSEA